MINRRKVVQMLGMAPVAAPMAAQHAANTALGSGACGLADVAVSMPEGPGPTFIGNGEIIRNHLLRGKIPDHLKAQIADSVRRQHIVNYDCAAMRSWSPVIRRRVAVERGIAQAERQAIEEAFAEKAREAFFNATRGLFGGTDEGPR